MLVLRSFLLVSEYAAAAASQVELLEGPGSIELEESLGPLVVEAPVAADLEVVFRFFV